jgi:hypothetical protein
MAIGLRMFSNSRKLIPLSIASRTVAWWIEADGGFAFGRFGAASALCW